eukprot:7373981-Pyramimonas_sp.AAC.1
MSTLTTNLAPPGTRRRTPPSGATPSSWRRRASWRSRRSCPRACWRHPRERPGIGLDEQM